VSIFYIVGKAEKQAIRWELKVDRVREHISDACLLKRHLLYDVRNAVGTLECCKHILHIAWQTCRR